MKKVLLFISFSIVVYSMSAQKSINSYKYIIIPEKFEFFKTVDKYQTSSLTKFLFNEDGYTAFLNSDKLPTDLKLDNCSSLLVNLKNVSGIFRTKIIIELKDCRGRLVYQSKPGKSKEKEYKRSYQEAIREAFKFVKALNYKYVPEVVLNKAKDVDKTHEIDLNKSKRKVIVTTFPESPKKIEKETLERKTLSKSTLYAQVTDQGYQLVDKTPKVVFYLLKTNNNNVFILKDKNGILYKKNDRWFAEFYEDNVLVQKEYFIKF